MTIEELRNLHRSWSTWLTDTQKRRIHFQSLTNFINHFEELQTTKSKELVLSYLNEYFLEVEDNNATLTSSQSYELATKFMDKIAAVYTAQLGFRSVINIKYVIIFSILGDSILFLFLHNKVRFYIPVVTILLFAHYLYRTLTLGKSGKLFGIFY